MSWDLSEVFAVLDDPEHFDVAVIGNGMTSRLWGGARRVPSLCLQGAMGMGLSVATGLAMAGAGPILVVEGDGNYLMGSPMSQWAQILGQRCFHVVVVNGKYQTSGGQALPVDLTGWSLVHSLDSLRQDLRGWAHTGGYKFVPIADSPVPADLPRLDRGLRTQVQEVVRRAKWK